jgi:CheY-like chemotaxis protein
MTALRVMIVEDEMILALDVEDMLLDAGYTVVGQASDMPEALAIAEGVKGGIDVAIMDINLARGSNGVETAAALRKLWNIPSLFVSGTWTNELGRWRWNGSRSVSSESPTRSVRS